MDSDGPEMDDHREPGPEVVISAPTEPPVGGRISGSAPRRRTWLWVTLALIAAIALGAGGYLAYDQLRAQDNATEDVDEAARLLESADATVIEVDDVIRSEVDADLGDRASLLKEDLASAISNLEQAVGLIDGALDDLPGADAPYARSLKGSALPRIEMLMLAEGLLDANIKAAAALDPSVAAWDKVLEAEAISDQAVAKYNELTKDSVTESVGLATQAEGLLTEARELFSEAGTGFPETDFSTYIEFCDGKLELLGLSKKADGEWLAGKISDANATIAQYNEKEAVLIELAKTLPDTPVEVVAAAYESLASEDTDAYFDARERATAADAALQEMGGVGSES